MSLQLPLALDGPSRSFPSFADTLKALGSIPSLLYQSLEFGTSQNRAFFEQLSYNERPRPHIREMIVRDQAKCFLNRNDFSVDDEEVSVGNEPLAALIVRCGPVQLRVLKGPGGVIPGCSDSQRRREFYNQQAKTYRDRAGTIRTARLNLVVLWEFDQYFNLAPLSLVLPIRAGERSADVVFMWNEPMPHPGTQIVTDFVADQKQIEDELERLLTDHDTESDMEKEA
jgi:hypothetical protein